MTDNLYSESQTILGNLPAIKERLHIFTGAVLVVNRNVSLAAVLLQVAFHGKHIYHTMFT